MLGACRLAGLSALEAYYAGSAWARNAGRTRARVRPDRAADLPEAVRRASLGLGVRSTFRQPQDHVAVALAGPP